MSGSRFVRWAAVVGDLGNPFYREERQRDVWNEASAVGLQTMIWLTLLVSSGALWIGGAGAVPYSLTMIFAMAISCVVTQRYAETLGVRPVSRRWLSMRRLVLAMSIASLFLGGMLRASWQQTALRNGMIIGTALGLTSSLVFGLLALRAADRAERAEADGTDVEA